MLRGRVLLLRSFLCNSSFVCRPVLSSHAAKRPTCPTAALSSVKYLVYFAACSAFSVSDGPWPAAALRLPCMLLLGFLSEFDDAGFHRRMSAT